MNRVTIMGRLGHDPKLVRLKSGTLVGHVNVVTDEGTERVEWHHVTVLGDIAEMCKDLHTGDTVLVEGRLSTRQRRDGQNFQRMYATTDIEAQHLWVLERRSAEDRYAKQESGLSEILINSVEKRRGSLFYAVLRQEVEAVGNSANIAD